MNTDSSKVRVLVIDDHALVRESIAHALASEPDMEIAHCASIAEAMVLLQQAPADVVLLDYDLGVERGSAFLPAAREAGFSGSVLVVTAWISDAEAMRLVRQGVSGIFLKEKPLAELAEAVRAVAGGGGWLGPQYLKLLGLVDAQGGEEQDRRRLSDRERKILRCVLEGLGNKEIASLLATSETSVKTILQRLFQKTGVRSRGQLVRVALERYKDLL